MAFIGFFLMSFGASCMDGEYPLVFGAIMLTGVIVMYIAAKNEENAKEGDF